MAEVSVQNFIGNEFIPVDSYLDSYDPSIGEVWAKIPDSDSSHVDKAVASAKVAFKSWRKTAPAERSKVMMKAAEILESRIPEFAQAESRDQGKPVSLATMLDIPRAAYNLRFFASAILHQVNKSSVQEQFNVINYTVRDPVGVTGIIAPWNLPLYLLTWKIAPCIAFGNTCVCKPSEMTSVTAWMFCQVLKEAGLPAGVVNMVFGLGPKVGEAMCLHPNVPLITFTGSTTTGQRIQRTTAPFVKKLSLELGGKNSAVVFSDTDLDKYLPSLAKSAFANQGEVCLCTERFLVQEEIYDDFVKRFVKAARSLKVGDPQSKDTTTGALVSAQHLDKVKGFVAMAIEDGGKIECGHSVDILEHNLPEQNKNGYFILPTVITGLSDSSRVNQEEIFGPVVTISPFKTEEEAVIRANSVAYGLSATVWSENVGRIHRVARDLEAGTVWCNCWLVRDLRMPFGGVKMSGVGRESQDDSLEFFTEQKNICVQL